MSLPISGSWYRVAAKGGTFCTMADSTAVSAVSTDGINWSSGVLPSSSTWQTIASNGTVFCVLSVTTANAATSTDGITWTARTLPSAGNWVDLAWNGTVFCAIKASTTNAATSPDGITWTARTLPSASAWSALAASPSVFCVISSGSAAATSSDGITWTARTLPAFVSWSSIAWNGTVFCIVENGGTNAATSPDGITWTLRTLPSSAAWTGIAWNGTLFCAISGGLSATSADGITWTQHVLPVLESWNGIAWNGTVFTAVEPLTTSITLASTDGITWYASLPVAGVSMLNREKLTAVGIGGPATVSTLTLPLRNATGTAVQQTIGAREKITAVGVAVRGVVTNGYQIAQSPPFIAATGTGVAGASIQSSVTLQGITGSGASAISSNVIRRALEAVSVAAAGQIGVSTTRLEAPITTAVASTPYVGVSDQTLAQAVAASAGIVGVVGLSRATLARMILATKGYSGVVATSVVTLPLFVQTSSGYTPAVGVSVNVSLPLIIATATGIESTGANFTTITMHTESQALSTYSNYPFNSFAKLNGVYLGASDAGIFALAGNTDAGVPIAASVRFGVTDFGSTKLKRVDGAYVAYRTDGDLVLRVTTDETITYDYALAAAGVAGAVGVKGNHVRVGKGLNARFWQFEVSNVNGSDFDLNSLDVKYGLLKRKVGGGDA